MSTLGVARSNSKKVLVIRCSLIDGVDPIEELRGVIAVHGFAWFGKYGVPVKSFKPDADGSYPLVLLVGNSKFTMGGGLGILYNATKCMFIPPMNEPAFPNYYLRYMDRISTWFRLQPESTPPIDLSELSVISSRQSLKRALASSMRGHFWCRMGMPHIS